MITAKEIAEKLAQDAEGIARLLLPEGKRTGKEWRVGDLGGNQGKSLGIHLNGGKAGVWSDFATGESGDLLDLWSKAKGISLSDAIRQAKDHLGIREPGWVCPKRKIFSRPERPKCQTPAGKVLEYLIKERKLTEAAVKAYRIGEQGEKVVFPSLREESLIAVKYLSVERKGGKKLISVEKDCEPCLFGWQAIPENVRHLVITEGEIDAMTLWDMGFPSVSVPFGGGSGAKQQWIEYEFENLSRFDTIFLCLDNDKAGQMATDEIVSRLGRHRCRIVSLPFKDANECLKNGWGKVHFEDAIRKARHLDPSELKSASAFTAEVINEFYPGDGEIRGFLAPWNRAIDKIRFRPGELSIWTGINGHGKSQVLGQVILASLDQGERACIASLEIKPRRLLYRLIRQATGIINPSIQFIQNAQEWFEGKLWILDALGSVKGDMILEVFRYARQRYGISQFVIDSLMKCGLGEDDYNAQKFFVEKLADFKNEHDVHVHLVAHSRKGESEDRFPGKLDVKGTGTITDLADNAFAIWRNKRKEEVKKIPEDKWKEKEREILSLPDAMLLCDKQRNGDWEGKLGLWWHPESFQLLDSENSKPKQYVPFAINKIEGAA